MKILSYYPVIAFLLVLSFAAAQTGCKEKSELPELHQKNVEAARAFRNAAELQRDMVGDSSNIQEANRALRAAEEARDDYYRQQN